MTQQPSAGTDPWERFGWMMSAVWLVFLAFPVLSVWQSDHTLAVRVLGLLAIAAFAVLYLFGFILLGRRGTPQSHRYLALAGLIVLTASLAPIIGVEALGTGSFLLAFTVFMVPWPRGGYVGGAVLGALLMLLLVSRASYLWFFGVLFPLTYGIVVLVRVLDALGARQQQAAREMVLVSERERVARDVHDVLGHSLTAITVKAELAGRLLEVDSTRAAAELADVQKLSRQALADIRSTVSGLRATRIGDELDTARESLTAAQIEADLPADAEIVGPSNRIVLAWALREAVTNVIRHSGANRCVVTLGPESLVVSDDGATGVGAEGNGLRGLRERLAAAGGTVNFGHRPDGTGHELKVTL